MIRHRIGSTPGRTARWRKEVAVRSSDEVARNLHEKEWDEEGERRIKKTLERENTLHGALETNASARRANRRHDKEPNLLATHVLDAHA